MSTTAPPWRQLSPQLFLGLSVGPDRLVARVTDLRGWWGCRYNASDLEPQRAADSIENSAAELLSLVARCYAAGEDDADLAGCYTFDVAIHADACPPTLSWDIGVTKLVFRLTPDADPAARIRDELLLPLMHAVDLLEAEADAATVERLRLQHNSAPPTLQLPDFRRRPLLASLLHPREAAPIVVPGSGADQPAARLPGPAQGEPEVSAQSAGGGGGGGSG
eukprot:CAMPEP_0185285416 /NCGR_PEP_ID=MMETSP1363-20130426/1706_1 /TAXON_ID=38817 /ORGANISM="Gephyrocapsa oceanica, Strain RCC1303" /LENGTH=220 /DNA_ID=CAMNT_0027881201 /DNA_START=23 /DNA_END=682 /DNA_ORIENTATION=+